MFGKSILCPNGKYTVIIRSQWQYYVKRDGPRRAYQCCNGSKEVDSILHELAKTYSFCVEYPVKQLFLYLGAKQNFLLFSGDTKDAFAHLLSPEPPTFMTIDNQYF